jgi:hypothetical protein
MRAEKTRMRSSDAVRHIYGRADGGDGPPAGVEGCQPLTAFDLVGWTAGLASQRLYGDSAPVVGSNSLWV